MPDPPLPFLVRVLGPFEISIGGSEVALGGPRPRLALAALVARANSVVSSDALMDVLWGDDLPEAALSSLQKYVYRLRTAIDPWRAAGGEGRLVTRAPGYLLRLESDECDALRFEHRAATARQAAAAGDLSTALDSFDDALGQWRGPAWAEFADLDFFRSDVARLEGLHAAAAEERTEVLLASGRHAQAVADLEAVVARHPLRERPRSQLVLALYRSGRQAEALRAYEDFRHYLAEEVGLAPSPALARLADAVLSQSPDLEWAPPAEAPGTVAAERAGSEPLRKPHRELPSGTVTFLFTDIAGSTELFRRAGHDYVRILDLQRNCIRTEVTARGGVEVNTEGDGMFFAFGGARAAVEASVAAQRALLAQVWPSDADVRVRMGLHTGEAAPHEGDYVALAVHQAARVEAAAHGGQILVSDVTARALGEDLREPFALRALGRYSLKDFEHGVDLLQVCHPEIPGDFPPPRLSTAPDNAMISEPQAVLPPGLSVSGPPFVGRDVDLGLLDILWERAEHGEHVAAYLYGPAGIGKTRLAAELASRVQARAASVCYAAGPDAARAPVVTASRDRPGPRLIVLDDLDSADLSVLAGAADSADGGGILVLGASRHAPHHDGLGGGNDAAVSVRELEGLAVDDVEALTIAVAGHCDDDLAAAVRAETEGIPELVISVAARLRDRETEARVERALNRATAVIREGRALNREIARGVLERQDDLQRTTSTSRVPVGECPYKGLAPFDTADAAYFFGRERLVAGLLTRLAVDRFVAVVGASGSGKSSLVRAGLLPALSAGALPNSGLWRSCLLTPGSEPMRRLGEALAPLAGLPAAELGRRLADHPERLDDALQAAVRGRDGARVVMVVDQFEELVTLVRDDEERDRFVAMLVDAVTDPEGPGVVIPTIRADYYGALAVHPDLVRLFEQSQVLVGAMTPNELRRATTEPARRAGLVLEDGLADAVCREAGDEPGALPLVSTALAETWVHRDGRVLTLDGYSRAGGVTGALARMAEEVYAGLDHAQQLIARQLLLRLAVPGESNDDVRRRMRREELPAGADVDTVIDSLVERRLLTLDVGTVEVAHEALLREWPRLRAWLEEDRQGRRLHRQLTEAANDWDGEGRDQTSLVRGSRLSALEDWAAGHGPELNPLEREFLDRSAAAREEEVRSAQRSARRFRTLTVALSGVLVVALAAGGLALVQRSHADRDADAAVAARISSDAARLAAQARALPTSQLDLSLLLAVQSRRLQESPTTDGAVEAALVHAPAGLQRVFQLPGTGAYQTFPSPDGRLIAAGTASGRVRVIDLATGRTLTTLSGGLPGGCQFVWWSIDSSRVIGVSPTHVVEWNATTGDRLGAAIPLPSAQVNSDAFELAPGRIVTASALSSPGGGVVTVWNTADPARPRRVTDFSLPSLPGDIPPGFWAVGGGPYGGGNPDLLAVSDATETQVWDIPTHQMLYPPLPGEEIGATADGSTAVSLLDGRLLFWDPLTGKERRTPLDVVTPPNYAIVFFSADGRRLATLDGPTNGTKVVDLTDDRVIETIPNRVPLGFLPDGRLAVFAASNLGGGSNLELWKVGAAGPAPFATPLGTPGTSSAYASPDGRTVFTVGADGLRTWRAYDGSPASLLLGDRFSGLSAYSPARPVLSADGRLVATDSGHGKVDILDATSGASISEIPTDGQAGEPAWSPSRRLLAVPSAAGQVVLWNLAVPGRPVIAARMHAVGFPSSSAPSQPCCPAASPLIGFSADGSKLLAQYFPTPTGPLSIPISVFSVPGGALLHVLRTGPAATVITADISPDGTTLATVVTTGAATGRLVLWDLRDGRTRASIPLPYFGGVSYGDRGRLIMTMETNIYYTGATARVDLWDASTLLPVGDPVQVPGDAALTPLVGREQTYVATGTTSKLGTPLVWNVDPGHWQSLACGLAGRNLSRAEWAQYMPGRPYQKTCPQWPAGS